MEWSRQGWGQRYVGPQREVSVAEAKKKKKVKNAAKNVKRAASSANTATEVQVPLGAQGMLSDVRNRVVGTQVELSELEERYSELEKEYQDRRSELLQVVKATKKEQNKLLEHVFKEAGVPDGANVVVDYVGMKINYAVR